MNKKSIGKEHIDYFKYMLGKQLKKLITDGKYFYEKGGNYVINDKYYTKEITFAKL